jgi:hypothetical protein
LICQLHGDYITFGSIYKTYGTEFANLMTDKFDMSSMYVLEFLIGFEVSNLINQAKYTQHILKRFKKNDVN